MKSEIEEELDLKIAQAQKEKGDVPLTNIERMIVYQREYNKTMIRIQTWAEKELEEYRQNNKEEIRNQFIETILR